MLFAITYALILGKYIKRLMLLLKFEEALNVSFPSDNICVKVLLNSCYLGLMISLQIQIWRKKSILNHRRWIFLCSCKTQKNGTSLVNHIHGYYYYWSCFSTYWSREYNVYLLDSKRYLDESFSRNLYIYIYESNLSRSK